MRKFVLIAGLLAGLAVFAPYWLGLIFRDIDTVDVSDLIISWESPERNAYDALIQLDEGNYLDILDEAAQADGFIEPGIEIELSLANAIPTVTGLLKATEASIAHAESLLEDGDVEAASMELDRTFRVIQMVDDAPNTLLQSHIVLTSKQLLFEAVRDNGLKMDVSDYSDFETSMINTYKFEFMLAQAFIADVEQEDLDIESGLLWRKANYYFHPNETVAEFAAITRENISNIQMTCDEPTVESSTETAPHFLFFTENAIGKIIIETLSPNLSSKAQICELESILNEL